MKRFSEVQRDSKSRRILNEIKRIERSREHTKYVKQTIRRDAAKVKRHEKGLPMLAEEEPQIKVLERIEDEIENSGSQDLIEDESAEDSSKSEVEEIEVEPEPEPEVEPETEVSTTRRQTRRPVAQEFVQQPRLFHKAVLQLTNWQICMHCNMALHNDVACRNDSLPNYYHLHCVQLAIAAKPD